MKRPSFQFYPGDWKLNAKLRRCTWAARGVWIEILGLLHDSDEYGLLRWPLKEIAQALGAPMKEVNELVQKGVLYGCEKGQCEPLTYRPKSGRVEGAEVTLVPAQAGPVWFSPRMVRDEYVRMKRGSSTRFGGDDDHSPMGGIGEGFDDRQGAPPNRPPRQRQGDGSSSSSSSSEIGKFSERGEGIEQIGGASPHQGQVGGGTDEAAAMRVGVPAAKRLRAIGIRVTALDPTLLALCAENFSVEDMALMASEQVLRKAHLFGDSDLHPELPELLASGATQQQMLLTPDQHAAIQTAAADIGIAYLAKALRGRRQDAIDKQSPIRPPKNGARRTSSADNFEGTNYVGTSIDNLSPELRTRVASQLAD